MDRWNPPARPLVLLVEGHAGTRAMYALALSAMAFNVVTAQDGAEAHRRVRVLDPDITVMDLPDADGGQFLQDLKQNPRTCDIPIVAVGGGYAERWLCERAERYGFAAFFPNPCLPDV